MPIWRHCRCSPAPPSSSAATMISGRAMQKAAVLRELRGSVHLVAVFASGLSDAQAHAIKRPGDVAVFGWEEAPAGSDRRRRPHGRRRGAHELDARRACFALDERAVRGTRRRDQRHARGDRRGLTADTAPPISSSPGQARLRSRIVADRDVPRTHRHDANGGRSAGGAIVGRQCQGPGTGRSCVDVDRSMLIIDSTARQVRHMTTYVRAPEAARRLGVSTATLYSYVSRGGSHRTVAADGRTSLFDVDELEALRARNTAAPGPTTDDRRPDREFGDATERGRVRFRDIPVAGRRSTVRTVCALLWRPDVAAPADYRPRGHDAGGDLGTVAGHDRRDASPRGGVCSGPIASPSTDARCVRGIWAGADRVRRTPNDSRRLGPDPTADWLRR